jgi:hypothetical protein
MSKKRATVHNKCEQIRLSPKEVIGHIENNDRILRFVMERSIGSGWDDKTS